MRRATCPRLRWFCWYVGLSRTTVTTLRQLIQANATHRQSDEALADQVVEADEVFQNAGEKGDEHFDPLDPPRRRATKRRGRGTYANGRPPVLGDIGRETGHVRLRVASDTKATTCVHSLSTLPNQRRWSTPTHMTAIILSNASGSRVVMPGKNGHGMTMATVGTKPIPIAMKACGPVCATSCVRFAVCIRRISMAMSPFMNCASISRPFRLP